MKLFLGLLFSTAFLFSFAAKTFAAGCEVVYGGGPVCTGQLSVSKMVQQPGKGGEFVHGLTINDSHYGPNATVPFQITVQNQGQSPATGIQVVDTLPQYLTYDSGDGSFNSQNNTVTLSISSLDAGKSQTFLVVARTAQTTALPKNQNVTCITNQVKITSPASNASDSSTLCIDKGTTTSVTTLPVLTPSPTGKSPATGPEDIVLPLLAATGTIGYFLRKVR